MKKTPLLSALVLSAFLSASADIVQKTPIAERAGAADQPPASQTLSGGNCTVIYYNFCSGWIWLWSGFQAGDVIGVSFDLPGDCCWYGGACFHGGHFWYWRYTQPAYGFTITYNLYDTDAGGCLTGESHGSATLDPVERWNFTGEIGAVHSEITAITATWDRGTLPYAVTDNNASNLNAGPVCNLDAGTPGTGSSLQYVAAGTTVYCPPAAFADGVGYTDLLVAGYFWYLCSCDIATEDASWGEIKSLFQ